MDVVLYYPKFPLGKKKYVVGGGSNRMMPPLDMGWVAKLLKKEGTINFKIVDANINRYSFDEVKKILLKLQPKIILTTSEPYEAYRCMSLIEDYLSIHKDCIEMIKETLPESQIILVGPHGTSFPDYVFKENPKLNFIVRGESEITSFELINALFKGENWREIKGVSRNNNGKIVHNEDRPYLENLDMLSYPAFHFLDIDKYLTYHQKKDGIRKILVISSRGCPYKCIYCFKAMVGDDFRSRSADNVLEEIDILYNRYNVDHIGFHDEIFTFEEERVGKICEKLKERKYQLTWSCETRIEKISIPLLEKMADAGCNEILFGVESLLPDIQKSAQKMVDINKLIEITRHAENVGIYCLSALQFGLPGDSRKTVEENIKKIKKLAIPISLPLITRVYPTTKLYEIGKEEKLIKEDSFEACVKASGLIKTEFKDRDCYYEALNYYHKAMKMVNRRKKYSLRRLVKKIKRHFLSLARKPILSKILPVYLICTIFAYRM
tara:strand:- start:343 stop:1824 length:1482 start_codon:yes stop_codon:yes gene_type:complete